MKTSGAAGYLVFSVGVLLFSLPLLFLGRFITGFFSGSVSILYSIIADLSSPQRRAANFALLGAAFSFGFIFGPVLGDILADPNNVSWFNDSTPFFTAMLLSLLSGLMIFAFIPETFKKTTATITKVNPLQGFKNINQAFAIKSLGAILLVIFLINLGFTFFTQYSAVYLLDRLNFNRAGLRTFFTYVGIWLLITQLGITQIASRKFQPRQIVVVAMLMLAAGLILFLLPKDMRMLYFVAPIMPISFGLFQPNMISIVSNSAGREIQGQILGIQQSIRSVAFMLPPLISAYIGSINVTLPNIVGASFVFIAWMVFVVNYSKMSIRQQRWI